MDLETDTFILMTFGTFLYLTMDISKALILSCENIRYAVTMVIFKFGYTHLHLDQCNCLKPISVACAFLAHDCSLYAFEFRFTQWFLHQSAMPFFRISDPVFGDCRCLQRMIEMT